MLDANSGPRRVLDTVHLLDPIRCPIALRSGISGIELSKCWAASHGRVGVGWGSFTELLFGPRMDLLVVIVKATPGVRIEKMNS